MPERITAIISGTNGYEEEEKRNFADSLRPGVKLPKKKTAIISGCMKRN